MLRWRNGKVKILSDMNESPYTTWRRKALEKFGNKCILCGSTEKLEFDHIDPSLKSFHISQGWSRKDIDKELDKCQLLCQKCHIEKTVSSLEPATHGSSYSWMKLKCKCQTCTESREKWYIERNARRRSSTNPKKPYGREVQHGDILSYTRGCRCDLCRKSNADRERNRRNSKK
jgi:hypothetical protein